MKWIVSRLGFFVSFRSIISSSQSFLLNKVPSRESVFYSTTRTSLMPRGVKKENLPSKVCVVCQRPFTWRKKWERCWDEVTTCSKSCNARRRSDKSRTNHPDGSTSESLQVATLVGDLADAKTSPSTRGEQVSYLKDILDSISNVDDDNVDDCESDSSSQLEKFNSNLESVISSTLDSQSWWDDEIREADDRKERLKAERKALKKSRKAERRALKSDPTAGQKSCNLCSKSVDLLIRCTIDETQTWNMVCGRCWKNVSGGVVDGDDQHPFYRYGGLWKNRRAVT
jgi:hypothetical protein